MKEITDQELFKIIDGDFSKAEEAKYLAIIESDQELSSRLSYLRSFDSEMRGDVELLTPSVGFEDRVVQNLHSIKNKKISVSLFNRKKWVH